ncbi:MAG: hypothetical protein ACE5GW_06550, partial [Planctomycetota bacterium]
EIDLVDWDSLGVRSRGRGRWPHSRSLRMPDPLSFRRCDVEEIFRSEGPVGEIIERLAEAAPPGEPAAPEGQPARGEGWHAPARLSPGDPAPN